MCNRNAKQHTRQTKIEVWGGQTASRPRAPNDYAIAFHTREGMAVGVYFLAGDRVLMVQTPHGVSFGIESDELMDLAVDLFE